MEELFVIVVEEREEAEGTHHLSHPHVVHIYSEVDERDHAFRVKDTTRLNHVFNEFYRKCELPVTERDLFKCESTGGDLAPYREDTFATFQAHGHCRQLVWIFTDKRKFEIIVNTERKVVETKHISFAQVAALAYPVPPTAPPGQTVNYTITYRHGPRENPEGTMRENTSVEIKERMIFDVAVTIRS